jgi:TonB family protein
MKIFYSLALILSLARPSLEGADSDGWCATKLQSLDYPALALQARISGAVHLGAHITTDGSVRDTRIISGNRILGEAAENNLRKWRFMRCSSGSGKDDDIEVSYNFELVGVTMSTPRTLFSYEHPYRVTISASAPHWTP